VSSQFLTTTRLSTKAGEPIRLVSLHFNGEGLEQHTGRYSDRSRSRARESQGRALCPDQDPGPGLCCAAALSSPHSRRPSIDRHLRTPPQTPVSKTGRYSNSRTLALVHRGGFEPPRPTRGNRVTVGPFQPGSRTCANLAEDRRIERPSLITMPWFSGPVAGHSAVPSAWRRVRELNPLASCERPCLADKCLTVRPTLRRNCQRTKKFW
jgi:hypothetical protein